MVFMSNQPKTVFVSSTFDDLRSYREIVKDTILQFGYMPIMMEHFPAMDSTAVDYCLREVRRSDLYLGIFAHRYGYCPRNSNMSITEMEFQEATKNRKPVHCFLIDEYFPWPYVQIEDEPGKSRLVTFKNRLKESMIIAKFTNPDNLGLQVFGALFRWQKEEMTKLMYISEYKVRQIITVNSENGRQITYIYVDVDSDDFDMSDFRRVLAKILNIKVEDVKINETLAGSVMLSIELPSQASKLLQSIWENNNINSSSHMVQSESKLGDSFGKSPLTTTTGRRLRKGSTRLESILKMLLEQKTGRTNPPAKTFNDRVENLAYHLSAEGVIVMVGELETSQRAQWGIHVRSWMNTYAELYYLLNYGLYRVTDTPIAYMADQNYPIVVVFEAKTFIIVRVMTQIIIPYIALRQADGNTSRAELRGLVEAVFDELGASNINPEQKKQMRDKIIEYLQKLLKSEIKQVSLTSFSQEFLITTGIKSTSIKDIRRPDTIPGLEEQPGTREIPTASPSNVIPLPPLPKPRRVNNDENWRDFLDRLSGSNSS